eukprot:14544944-Alexandrium_andersonii.AAC.1
MRPKFHMDEAAVPTSRHGDRSLSETRYRRMLGNLRASLLPDPSRNQTAQFRSCNSGRKSRRNLADPVCGIAPLNAALLVPCIAS